ncbi:biotin-independent malonate decarboxylase subunit gamma [Acuticoccus sediminis]|uniref:biotin-independent malonate decarboxylase subunit gamma n=1 Tax=Acuticoccus sediminis TaxID=2184697 RepID=UPI001CFE1B45|nr:biotin-independent malonate decarboxylase subunit gamma [Acuticoccus sediminis]
MTRDDILEGLFARRHTLEPRTDHLLLGTGRIADGRSVEIVGIADGIALGVDAAIVLAERVLDIVRQGGDAPILVMVDTMGQKMARRDEMLGLNEYLAHLAKSLLLASRAGHPTVGLVTGKAAAGAFLATALATDVLVALPEAEPAVMDLPSIARVTKLPQDWLAQMATSTPVFAPGVQPMHGVGAIAAIWDPGRSLAEQFDEALRSITPTDRRDVIGAERGGRTRAAAIVKQVAAAMGGEHAESA